MKPAEIAALTGAQITGDSELEITGLASIEEAQPGELVFAENERYFGQALKSRASLVLVKPEMANGTSTEKSLALVENPRIAFLQILEALAPPFTPNPGIHETALTEGAVIAEGVSIGPYVTVGKGTRIEAGVAIMAGVRIGEQCVIGEGTIIHANAVIFDRVRIGKRCLLQPGSVLGGEGFGFVPVGSSLRKVPQLGTVELGDEVEIGCNSCVDRAKTGVTRIGSGTKIDNLVHVGHNVHIGQCSILIAQVGVAGGVEVGNGVILAGQVGIKDHVTIGDGARVGAQGGVTGNVPAGQIYSGYPARPHNEKMKEAAALTRLPDYIKRIRDMEKRLAELEARAAKA